MRQASSNIQNKRGGGGVTDGCLTTTPFDDFTSGTGTVTPTSKTTITTFLHRVPDLDAQFYRIKTADGAQIKLTAHHFIYVVQCDMKGIYEREKIFAADVRWGNCLLKVDEELRLVPTPVINITQVSTL